MSHQEAQGRKPKGPSIMEGVIVIDKPTDLTSHDVVARVRHILHERRIGHTGTLDPFATGVLVLLLGKATRLAQFLTSEDKEYDAIIRLGYATDTGDRTGTPIDGPSSAQIGKWDEQAIEAALGGLRGWIDQVPPMYSAKKRAGRKLYELARQGETVDREPLRVCIHEFTAIKPDGQLFKDNMDGTFDFRARVVCSSGTYVRTLAEDFGKRLSVSAHLAELRRTRVGDFRVENAVTLDDLKTSFAEESLGSLVAPPSAALSRLPFVHLSAEDVRNVSHGREIKIEGSEWADGENVKLCDAGDQLIAVGRYDAGAQLLHPHVVLT
jgi:tRNA pseudouridine55 synthase